MIDLTGAAWHKTSRSTDNGTCVEVADNLPGVIDSETRHGCLRSLGSSHLFALPDDGLRRLWVTPSRQPR